MSTSKKIGILFQADMVRAILEGRKTLTSRLQGLGKLNESPNSWQYNGIGPGGVHVFENTNPVLNCGVEWIKSPYGQAGDVLVGRETFWCDVRDPGGCVIYAATPELHKYSNSDMVQSCDPGISTEYLERHEFWVRKRSIHMPYWASRLLLTVVRVWPSRLQDMTEDEAKAEGCDPVIHPDGAVDCGTRKTTYHSLWDRINGETHPWASNPWVWRVRFRFSDQS